MRCVFPRWQLRACLVLAVVSLGGARAQNGYTAPERSVGEAIESLARRAADIFTGQVIAIDRRGGAVEITFAVEQTLQGQAGTRYSLREWAGLWPPGQFRYRIGERALVFMLPANAAGLSSPVDGSEGVLPLVVTSADGATLVDARRLDARLVRTVGQPLPDESTAAMALDDAVQTIQTARTLDEDGNPRHAAPPRRFPLHPVPKRLLPPSGIGEPGQPSRPAQPIAASPPVLLPALPSKATRFAGGPVRPEVPNAQF